MSIISRIFGRPKIEPPEPATASGDQDPLLPVPIPALGVLLLNIEKQKGSPLTEQEVMAARDKAVCMMLPLSVKRAMDEKRGYEDINPENVWPEWLAFRAAAHGNEP